MYVSQKMIRPITAKKWATDHWKDYGLADSKKDFLALLNILQACGENLDSLHDVCLNGSREFCDIVSTYGWGSDREVADALLQYCSFFTQDEFMELILECREDYETQEEYVEAMRREASDEPEDFSDVQITKTEDGYVKRVWY